MAEEKEVIKTCKNCANVTEGRCDFNDTKVEFIFRICDQWTSYEDKYEDKKEEEKKDE
jgi:hypothetical protein